MVVERMMFRGEEINTITLRRWTSHGKEWAARIRGVGGKFGLELEFCPIVEKDWSRSGSNGTTTVKLLGEGYYKISDPDTGKYGRECYSYYYFDGENLEEVTENDVYIFFKQKKESM